MWRLGTWMEGDACPAMVNHSGQLGPEKGEWGLVAWEAELKSGLRSDWGGMLKNSLSFASQRCCFNRSQRSRIVHSTSEVLQQGEAFLITEGRKIKAISQHN